MKETEREARRWYLQSGEKALSSSCFESLDDLNQIFNACTAYLLLIGIDIS